MNQWYAAHIITYNEWKDKGQNRFVVWENVCLLKAGSDRNAWHRANVISRKHYATDKDFGATLQGHLSRSVLVGVRKLIVCSPPDIQVKSFPGDKLAEHIEVTYSRYEVSSLADVKKLAAGKIVQVRYLE